MVTIDPGADTIQYIGDAALDAAGLGFAAPLWDAFFPPDDPVFSQAQLDQLTTLFEELFAAEYYQQNLDSFTAATTLCDEYANNPTPGQLAQIQTQTENTAVGLYSNGFSTARVYLAAALLHVLTLKFAWEAAPDDAKPGAAKNIAQAALDTLDSLVELEIGYGAATGWQEFSSFKQATVMSTGSMSDGALAAFGDDYGRQVQGLMGLVDLYSPEDLDTVAQPPYLMLVVPYDAASTPCTWSASCNSYQNTIYMFKCQSLPPNVPEGYYPLSDLAVTTFGGAFATPGNVVYVTGHAAELVKPTSFQHVYDDHGSGLSQDYAGFWTVPLGIGSWSAADDGAGEPDDPGLCQLVDSAYYEPVELSSAVWDDTGTGADEDGTVYLHPQFGDFGVYVVERSHSRPDPDTVNGLSMRALAGHPAYTPSS